MNNVLKVSTFAFLMSSAATVAIAANNTGDLPLGQASAAIARALSSSPVGDVTLASSRSGAKVSSNNGDSSYDWGGRDDDENDDDSDDKEDDDHEDDDHDDDGDDHDEGDDHDSDDGENDGDHGDGDDGDEGDGDSDGHGGDEGDGDGDSDGHGGDEGDDD